MNHPSFQYRANSLFCEDVSVASIAARFGTPTYAYSQAVILENFRQLEAGLRPQDVALGNYAGRFIHTPIYSHAAFALLAIILLAVLLRRRLAGDLAMAFMLIGAFAFVLSFFVISIACDYRYLLFLDLSALTAGFHLAVAPQNRPKKEI